MAATMGMSTKGIGFEEVASSSAPGAGLPPGELARVGSSGALGLSTADFIIPPAEHTPQRHRKIQRMQAVRQSESGASVADMGFQSYMVFSFPLYYD